VASGNGYAVTVLALGFIALWSSGYVVGALAVQAVSPLALLGVRFPLALLLAVPIAMRTPGWDRAPIRRLVVIGLLMQGVQFAGIYGGLGLGVPAALSSLVVLGLAPAATTLIARATGMERPSRRKWLMLVVGIAGVAISLAPELGGAHIGIGIALTVIGMLGLAGGTVLQKRWVSDVDSRIIVTVQLVTVAVLMAPAATVASQWHVHLSLKLAWTLAWLAWPLSVGSMALLALLLRRYSASTTSILLLLVPAATALESAIVLRQQLSPISLLGMAVTLVAVADVVRHPAGRPVTSRRCGSTRPVRRPARIGMPSRRVGRGHAH
jgi:drug/metabolite transporter (DMT)-like permease